MNIKGSAVKTIKDYMETNHPEKYNEWMDMLPIESKSLFSSPIYATNWYPIETSAVIPTEKIGELIFNSPEEGAYALGKYNAEVSLNGIYKVFVKVLNPTYLIQRASKIISTYYDPATIIVASQGFKFVVLHITEFSKPNVIIEKRIAGWIQRALEIAKCKNVNVEITKSLTKGDSVTEYNISWN